MRRLTLLTILALGPTSARAENAVLYLGAGISSNSMKNIVLQGNAYPNINGTSWKVFAGVRPTAVFAVEVDYYDLGSGTFDTGGGNDRTYSHSDAQAFAAYAVGFVPITLPYLDIYGKAGVARSKLSGSGFSVFDQPPTSSSSAGSDHDTAFSWGVGVQVHINMVGARIEYEQFDISNTSGAKIVSLSLLLDF